jgi:hypothetical protein
MTFPGAASWARQSEGGRRSCPGFPHALGGIPRRKNRIYTSKERPTTGQNLASGAPSPTPAPRDRPMMKDYHRFRGTQRNSSLFVRSSGAPRVEVAGAPCSPKRGEPGLRRRPRADLPPPLRQAAKQQSVFGKGRPTGDVEFIVDVIQRRAARLIQIGPVPGGGCQPAENRLRDRQVQNILSTSACRRDRISSAGAP